MTVALRYRVVLGGEFAFSGGDWWHLSWAVPDSRIEVAAGTMPQSGVRVRSRAVLLM
jgi:hypothetical protein